MARRHWKDERKSVFFFFAAWVIKTHPYWTQSVVYWNTWASYCPLDLLTSEISVSQPLASFYCFRDVFHVASEQQWNAAACSSCFIHPRRVSLQSASLPSSEPATRQLSEILTPRILLPISTSTNTQQTHNTAPLCAHIRVTSVPLQKWPFLNFLLISGSCGNWWQQS